jgi:carbon storage regulator
VLVLRRRQGERIAIGHDIEIEIIAISRTRVKLGVTAPREVSVLRKETLEVAAENRRALELISGSPETVNAALRRLETQGTVKLLKDPGELPICPADGIPGIPENSGTTRSPAR